MAHSAAAASVAQHPPAEFPQLHAVVRLSAQSSTAKAHKLNVQACLKALARGESVDEVYAANEQDHVQESSRIIQASKRESKTKKEAPTPLAAKANNVVYDVKFYPYTAPDEDAVFAVVAADEVYVYRPQPNANDPVEVLFAYRDPYADASLNSLVWSQDPATGDPLLCFGGARSGEIKIVNVLEQKLVCALSGHGGAIQDLAVSPLTPTILASASADFSIRLWNLDARFQSQPCAAILASPDAHKQSVLTIAFHAAGNYLLSGGTDTMINLWPLPAIPSGQVTRKDKLAKIFFPLFSSTEVHPDYVDCVKFHGDLILSHCATSQADEHGKYSNESILLWKINGFSSADALAQDEAPAAQPGTYTRSAFGKGFQRLLTFEMPDTPSFYMRFSIFNRPGFHPVLVMGNDKSKFSFWDLFALENGAAEAGLLLEGGDVALRGGASSRRGRGGARSGRGVARRLAGVISRSSTAATTSSSSIISTPSRRDNDDAPMPDGLESDHTGLDDYDESSNIGDDNDRVDQPGASSRNLPDDGSDGSPQYAVRGGGRLGSRRGTAVAGTGRSLKRGGSIRDGRGKRMTGEGGEVVGGGGGGGRGGGGGGLGGAAAGGAGEGVMMIQPREGRFDTRDPFFPLPPHHIITVPRYNFCVRQTAWSNCGRWCVGVGEAGLAAVFRRWC